MSWADVVPGAVRVQMDSSTTLVRGRKEFDWILTPVQPGRQSVPAIRYPFFNPYTEQYEVAIGRVDSVTISGEPVVADRSASDSTPGAADPSHVRGRGAGADHRLAGVLVAHRDGATVTGRCSCGAAAPASVRSTPPEAQLRAATSGDGCRRRTRQADLRARHRRARAPRPDGDDGPRLAPPRAPAGRRVGFDRGRCGIAPDESR